MREITWYNGDKVVFINSITLSADALENYRQKCVHLLHESWEVTLYYCRGRRGFEEMGKLWGALVFDLLSSIEYIEKKNHCEITQLIKIVKSQQKRPKRLPRSNQFFYNQIFEPLFFLIITKISISDPTRFNPDNSYLIILFAKKLRDSYPSTLFYRTHFFPCNPIWYSYDTSSPHLFIKPDVLTFNFIANQKYRQQKGEHRRYAL